MFGIIRNITQLNRCGAQYRAERLEQYGLKACHASYLMEICADPGLSQDTLAQRLCINKSNVARQMTVLEEGGFVRRQTSAADKRVMEVYPTEKTMEQLQALTRILEQWSAYLTQDLTEEERRVLMGMLDKMMCRGAAWLKDPKVCAD